MLHFVTLAFGKLFDPIVCVESTLKLMQLFTSISLWQGLYASNPVGAVQHNQFRSVLTHPLWDRPLPSHDREDSNPQRPHQRRICHFILPGESTIHCTATNVFFLQCRKLMKTMVHRSSRKFRFTWWELRKKCSFQIVVKFSDYLFFCWQVKLRFCKHLLGQVEKVLQLFDNFEGLKFSLLSNFQKI